MLKSFTQKFEGEVWLGVDRQVIEAFLSESIEQARGEEKARIKKLVCEFCQSID